MSYGDDTWVPTCVLLYETLRLATYFALAVLRVLRRARGAARGKRDAGRALPMALPHIEARQLPCVKPYRYRAQHAVAIIVSSLYTLGAGWG